MAERFRSFTSAVIPLPAENVDTDQIVPARYLKVTDKDGLREALFRDWRYDEDGGAEGAACSSWTGSRCWIARSCSSATTSGPARRGSTRRGH